MEQIKLLTELLTKQELYKLYCDSIQEIEELREENEHIKRRCVSNCVQD